MTTITQNLVTLLKRHAPTSISVDIVPQLRVKMAVNGQYAGFDGNISKSVSEQRTACTRVELFSNR